VRPTKHSAATGKTGKDREQESMMRKMTKKPILEAGMAEDAIDRIAVRRLAAVQHDLVTLRAYVEATRAW
jgi:hypothetical protein